MKRSLSLSLSVALLAIVTLNSPLTSAKGLKKRRAPSGKTRQMDIYDLMKEMDGESDGSSNQPPLDEEVTYHIGIYDKKPDKLPQGDVEFMTSSGGRSYICILPDPNSETDSDSETIDEPNDEVSAAPTPLKAPATDAETTKQTDTEVIASDKDMNAIKDDTANDKNGNEKPDIDNNANGGDVIEQQFGRGTTNSPAEIEERRAELRKLQEQIIKKEKMKQLAKEREIEKRQWQRSVDFYNSQIRKVDTIDERVRFFSEAIDFANLERRRQKQATKRSKLDGSSTSSTSQLHSSSENEEDRLRSRMKRRNAMRKRRRNQQRTTNAQQQSTDKELDSGCFQFTDGTYWSYQVCVFERMLQFHGPQQSPKVELGKFSRAIPPPTRGALEDSRVALENWDANGVFLHLQYVDGSGGRKAELVIQCSDVAGKSRKPQQYAPGEFQADLNGKHLWLNAANTRVIKAVETKALEYKMWLSSAIGCAKSFYHLWLADEHSIAAIQPWLEPGENVGGSSDLPQGTLNLENGANAKNNGKVVGTKFIGGGKKKIPKISSVTEDTSKNPDELKVEVLLEALRNAPCLELAQGWWTVEFCYGRYVRQVHRQKVSSTMQVTSSGQRTNVQSAASGKVLEEHSMGRAPHRNSWKGFTLRIDELNPLESSASMSYGGGDICESSGGTNVPRQTTIHFKCSVDSGVSRIVHSREEESCVYWVLVETPVLCEHPLFAAKPVPSVEIVCYPFDSSDLPALAGSGQTQNGGAKTAHENTLDFFERLLFATGDPLTGEQSVVAATIPTDDGIPKTEL